MRTAGLFVFVLCALYAQGLAPPTESKLAKEIRSNMDFTVNPCDDFYQFVCGNWLNKTVLSNDETIVTKSFSLIEKQNRETVENLLQGHEKLDPKLSTFWKSCMNLDAIDAKDPATQLASLYQDIQSVEQEKVGSSAFLTKFFTVVAKLHVRGANALFSFSIAIDSQSPKQYLPTLQQAGLHLPDKSYYNDKYIPRFQQHIETMFSFVNLSDNGARAIRVIEMESALALISLSNDALRDPFATYNKFTAEQVFSKYPRVFLRPYFQAAGVPREKLAALNIATPKFFADVNALLGNTTFTSAHYADYLRFAALNSVASFMTQTVRNENFAFFGKFLSGTQEPSPRKDSCVASTDQTLGMLSTLR